MEEVVVVAAVVAALVVNASSQDSLKIQLLGLLAKVEHAMSCLN